MTHSHLVFDGRLTECAAKGFVVEKRIVPEAACSARSVKNSSFHSTAKSPDQLALFGQCDRAYETSGAIRCGLQAIQQQCVVLSVRSLRTCVARRMDPWRSTQRIHFQAAV